MRRGIACSRVCVWAWMVRGYPLWLVLVQMMPQRADVLPSHSVRGRVSLIVRNEPSSLCLRHRGVRLAAHPSLCRDRALRKSVFGCRP